MCDLYFGLIERTIKNTQNLTQTDYEEKIRNCHCIVKTMSQDSFWNWNFLKNSYKQHKYVDNLLLKKLTIPEKQLNNIE